MGVGARNHLRWSHSRHNSLNDSPFSSRLCPTQRALLEQLKVQGHRLLLHALSGEQEKPAHVRQ